MTDPFEFNDEFEPQPMMAAPVARPYLDGLNAEQRAAVETTEGPVLILAGAGTGKTRVLTTRLGHILNQRLAHAGEVLAVTFTNKAAREMKERVASLLGRPVEGFWLGTFHALATRMLRKNAEVVGLKSDFTILDTDDQVRLIKQVMQALQVDEKKNPPRHVLGVIQRWKDRGLVAGKVSPAEGAGFCDGQALAIYRDYQERLRINNAADFGDLLLHCLTLFQKMPDVLRDYQQRFRYILVDEYQDTNVGQYLWLRLLGQGHKNICCVGDDDQSIYSWRGAEVANILRFEQDFPGATVIRLERNYRSTGHILAAASGLIAHNEDRHGKTLWTEDDMGQPVRVKGVWDGEAEARLIGDEIEDLQRKGESLDEMAILVRAGFQTREFEERLIVIGVPYKVVGGLRFYERQECRDLIAYLRVVASPSDNLAFERIINLPKRGVGKAALAKIYDLARVMGVPLTAAVRELCQTDELSPKLRTVLSELLLDFDRWRVMLNDTPLDEVAGIILDESGYMQMWKDLSRSGKKGSVEAEGRMENLRELVNGLEAFETLAEFLQHVALVMDNEANDDTAKVSIMTLHAAKGLEFDNVFLPGWEDGLFPHQRSMDESGMKGLEEERRLAYVGITRAKKQAMITHAANRRVYNQWQSSLPSRFIDELPDAHISSANDVSNHQLGVYNTGFTYGGRAINTRREMLNVDAYDIDISAGDQSSYRRGDRVFHQKFGYGDVISTDGNKLDIQFDKAGRKKVMDSFVEGVK